MLHRPQLKHTLVVFKICPWCIRVLTMMHQKNLDMEVKFIEIWNKPEWFLKISPLGKVPILIIGESVVLFESTAIMEYMDEMVKPQLLSQDPIDRAIDRGRFEFGSETIKCIYQFAFACDEEKFMKSKEQLCKYFATLEEWCSGAKYFNGNELSLIDICFVPIFASIFIISKVVPCDFMQKYPKLVEYSKQLNLLPSVKKGRVPDYEQLLLDGVKKQNSFLYRANPTLFQIKQ